MKRLANVLIPVVLLAALPAAAGTVLDIDFEGLPLDQPIGTGGPYQGEPISQYNCGATVRTGPTGTPCLELEDIADFGAGYVIFEFLQDAEPTGGTVEISTHLWFAEADGGYVYVREHGGSADSYASLRFSNGGALNLNDAAGNSGAIGSWSTGVMHELRLVFDMDAGTYDVLLDGALLVDDRAHGITGSGVGRIIVGVDHDSDLDGLFYVDDLRVTADDIVAGETVSWGDLKRDWR